MKALLRHHQNLTNNFSVGVDWHFLDRHIEVNFQVTNSIHSDRTPEWNVSDLFKDSGCNNLGLWDYDVVEFFLQKRSTPDDIGAPYLEMEVSPLAQKLLLEIITPRKKFHLSKQYEFSGISRVENNIWSSQIQFPQAQSGLLYGGFFACLGQRDNREYFSLNPNSEMRADFHRPELFLPLR